MPSPMAKRTKATATRTPAATIRMKGDRITRIMINHQAIAHSPIFSSILILQYEMSAQCRCSAHFAPMTLLWSFDLVPSLGVKAGALSKVRLKVGTESMAGLVGLEAVVVKRVCRTRTAKRLFKKRFIIGLWDERQKNRMS